MSNDEDQSKELEFHKYTGNSVPRILRLAWTAFLIFALVYLVSFGWPDLREWFSKL